MNVDGYEIRKNVGEFNDTLWKGQFVYEKP